MNRRNKIALLILLPLAGITCWLMIKNHNSTLDGDLSDFAITDTAAITKIFLADKNKNKVEINKQQNGSWIVNKKYVARKDLVQTLLYTAKALEVRSPVGRKATEKTLSVMSASAVKIELYKGDILIKTYLVGHPTQDQLGTHMLLIDPKTGKNSRSPYVMYIPGFEGYLTPRYTPKEEDWRDLTVFQHIPTQIQSVKLEYAKEKENNFEVTQPQPNQFSIKLPDARLIFPFDTLKVKQYLSYFQKINFEYVVKKASPTLLDSLEKVGEKLRITVKGTNSEPVTIRLFEKPAENGRMDETNRPMVFDPDRMYAVISTNPTELVSVQYFVFGKLFQTPGYFIPNKKTVKK